MAFQVYILEQAESVPTWTSQPHCMSSPPNHRSKLLPGAPPLRVPFGGKPVPRDRSCQVS